VNAYLDPVTETTGALRVVPATQHGSLPVDIARQLGAGWSREDPSVMPGVALSVSPAADRQRRRIASTEPGAAAPERRPETVVVGVRMSR
jgi:hypothetical protein